MQYLTGKLVSLRSDKGFGFIRCQNTEYFFHREDYEGTWSQLVEDYVEGLQIELTFSSIAHPKGPRASSVSKILTNEQRNEPCKCSFSSRLSNESMHEWLKRCMCQVHWMDTDYYKNVIIISGKM